MMQGCYVPLYASPPRLLQCACRLTLCEVVATDKPHEPDDSCTAAEETRTSDGSEVLSVLEDLEAPAEAEEAIVSLDVVQ